MNVVRLSARVALLSSALAACGGSQSAPAPSAGSTAAPAAIAVAPAPSGTMVEPKHQLLVNLDSSFMVRERTATATIILEVGKERLLEIHKFEKQGCSDELIPRIGEATATTREETEMRGELEFRWFSQRSSIEHAPFTSVGFYLCSNRSFLLLRYVGPENAIKSAKARLRELLANRSIVVE